MVAMDLLRARRRRDSDEVVVGCAALVRPFRVVLPMINSIARQDAPRPETTSLVPQQVVFTDAAPRCWRCKRKLAELVSRPWQLNCSRCKAQNASPPSR